METGTAMNMDILEVKYIGRSKERRPGDFSALGWRNGQWSIIFPEKVLRQWFHEEDPRVERTLFGVLGIAENATQGEIKTAYRRMAMSYHPDVCKEPDAHEVFLRIQEAYAILSNPIKQGKYLAGLEFEKQSSRNIDSNSPFKAVTNDPFGYRSPLRCGLILCKGDQQKKWFVVSEIMQWADITNANGQTLVSSWIYGEDKPQERWV